MLAPILVACSGGAQVGAGMLGNHFWQGFFLMLTMLTAWFGTHLAASVPASSRPNGLSAGALFSKKICISPDFNDQ